MVRVNQTRLNLRPVTPIDQAVAIAMDEPRIGTAVIPSTIGVGRVKRGSGEINRSPVAISGGGTGSKGEPSGDVAAGLQRLDTIPG